MKRIATALFLAATAQAGWFNSGYDATAERFCRRKGLKDDNCGDTGAPCNEGEACLSGTGGV